MDLINVLNVQTEVKYLPRTVIHMMHKLLGTSLNSVHIRTNSPRTQLNRNVAAEAVVSVDSAHISTAGSCAVS